MFDERTFFLVLQKNFSHFILEHFFLLVVFTSFLSFFGIPYWLVVCRVRSRSEREKINSNNKEKKNVKITVNYRKEKFHDNKAEPELASAAEEWNVVRRKTKRARAALRHCEPSESSRTTKEKCNE